MTNTYEGDDFTDNLSRREFLEVVRRAVHDIQHERVDIVNVVFRVIWGNGSVTNLSLPTASLDDLDAVIDSLEIGDHDSLGSDNFSTVLRLSHIYTSWFRIVARDTEGGAGEAAVKHTLCYRVLSHRSDGDCLYKCLEYLSGNLVPITAVQGMRDVNEIAAMYGIEVGVYEDRYNVAFTRVETDTNQWGTELRVMECSPSLLCGDDNSDYKLLYHDRHYSVILKAFKPESCYCMITGELVGHRNKLTYAEISYHLTGKGLTEDDDDEDNILCYFFDYETTYDHHGNVTPYAWAVSKWHNQMLVCTTVGFEKTRYNIIDYLTRESVLENKRKKYLVGFNNSRFDNHILLRQALCVDKKPTLCIFADSTIINMNLMGFIVRDVQRFVQTNLRDACKSFGCEFQKGELDHEEIQAARLNNKLQTHLQEHRAEIEAYVKADAECTGELFFKVKKAIKEMLGAKIESHITLSSMMYKHLCLHNDTEKPVVKDVAIDAMIRSAVIGGRAQVFELGKVVDDRDVVCLDMTSEYPYVLCSQAFPIGLPVATPIYVPGRIGVYQVTVMEQPSPNILPKREADLSLDWDYAGEIKIIATSVDIMLLLKYKADVRVSNGFYWEESSKEIFREFLQPMIDTKLKIDAGGDNNIALRNMCKLGMNGLSGKLIQKLHKNSTSLICSSTDALKFISKVIPGYTIEPVLEQHYWIGHGTKSNVDNKMPSVWGVLIYSYARSMMYEFITLFNDRYGMDTDSLFTSKAEYDRVKAERPELFGNAFGQFKEELHKLTQEEDVGPFGIYINKKVYVNYVLRDGKEVAIKMRMKGIDTQKDKVITDQRYIECHINASVNDRHSQYYDRNNRSVTIEDYRRMAAGDSVYILCSHMQRKRLLLNSNFVLKKMTMGSAIEI